MSATRGVAEELDRLAIDTRTGKHDEPYLAVVTLIYADEPPRVLVATPEGRLPTELNNTVLPEKDEPPNDNTRPVWFKLRDLEEANGALGDAAMGWRCYPRKTDRLVPKETMGEFIAHWIERGWARSRDFPIEQALKAAAYLDEYPHLCSCRERFKTERGMKQHFARSWRHANDRDAPCLHTENQTALQCGHVECADPENRNK